MAAIITDQLRIKNARSFIDRIRSSTDSFYTFIGLPNATENKTDWDREGIVELLRDVEFFGVS